MENVILEEGISLEREVLGQISRDIVLLQFGKWNQFRMSDITPHIQEWKCKQLIFSMNYEVRVIPKISHIKLSSLISLTLDENVLFSVESILSLHLPQLASLHLNNNLINSLKPLRKSNWPKLKFLRICDNLFPEINSLCEGNFFNLRNLKLEKEEDDNGFGSNLKWLAKSEMFKIEQLWVMSDKRIWTPSLKTWIRNKWMKKSRRLFSPY